MSKKKKKSNVPLLSLKRAGLLSWKFGIFGFIVSFALIILSFLETLFSANARIFLRGLGVSIALATLIFLFPEIVKDLYKRLYVKFSHLVPWLLLACFILCLSIYFSLLPSKKDHPIPLDRAKGAIYNSWDHHSDQNKHIVAWGSHPENRMWVIDEYGTGHFSYRADPSVPPNDTKASSGGYMTFYGKPCDRLAYRKVCFDCKISNTEGLPDLGIRLSVDNPKLPKDKECVSYEIPSLRSYYKSERSINGKWQTFIIDIADFNQVRYEPPFPILIDENTLNKIVFFVNNDIVQKCQKGTLWFRDIVFKIK